jgi:hypothetical protein
MTFFRKFYDGKPWDAKGEAVQVDSIKTRLESGYGFRA